MQIERTALNELLSQLRTVGKDPPRELFDDILTYGQEAVAPLVEIVIQYPISGLEEDERKYFAAYHAIKLLGELHAPEGIRPILALIDEEDDFIGPYISESLGQIGQPAIEPLRELIFAPGANMYGVATAANALARMADLAPELRTGIVQMMIERFEANIPTEDPNALRAFLASDLADMRAVEAKPAIDRAYTTGRIEDTIIDRETYETIMNRPEGMSPEDAMAPLFEQPRQQRTLGEALLRFGEMIDPQRDVETPPEEAPALASATTRRPQPFGRKVGRNEPCPCGSGKKYKRCHGR